MKAQELYNLIVVSYNQVGLMGRDAARIYHAVVELDGQVLMWRKRARDLGWTDEPVAPAEPPAPAVAEEPVTK